MLYYSLLFFSIIFSILIVLLLGLDKDGNLPDSNLYTTFLGSDFSTLIRGELTKESVQKAENIIGTIRGVQIGTLVTSIGNITDTIDTSPFYNQTEITSLTFKDLYNSQCTTIGSYAFKGCTGLTSVTFPKSIENIENLAFDESLFSLVIFEGSGLIRTVLIESNSFSSPMSLISATLGGSISVEEDGNTYDDSAENTTFIGGSNYTIKFGGELTKSYVQEAEAVVGTITEVRIGTLITSVGNSSDTISTAPFYNKTNLTTLIFNDLSTSRCTYTGKNCFGGCTGLTSVIMPDSIITIYESSFPGCSNITSFILSESLEYIGLTAFAGCTSLTTLDIPNSVITIFDVSFTGCTSLAQITISNSITTISDFAFDGCPLAVVAFNGSGISRDVTVSSTAFSDPPDLVTASSGGTITVPADGIIYYSDDYTTFLGSDYSILINGELTKTHVQEAEAVIGTVRGVKIGQLVTSIGNISNSIATSPFADQTSITSLTFRGTSTCTTIGNSCFYQCTGLTSITLANSITLISIGAFNSCTGLTSVTLSNTIDTIDIFCFVSCTSLTSITFPSSISVLSAFSFGSCPLTSVIFDGTGSIRVITIPSNCFAFPLSLVYFTSGGTLSIPAAGFSYKDTDSTLFLGDNNSYQVFITGTFTSTYKNDAASALGEPIKEVYIGIYCTGTENNLFVGYSDLIILEWRDINNSTFVNLPNQNSFKTTSITELILPPSLTYLGNWSFSTTPLTGIISIPPLVSNFGFRSFEYTDITGVYFEGSAVVVIQEGAFQYCDSVTTVNIPTSVDTIRTLTFFNCPLTSLTFEAGQARTITIGLNTFTAPASFSTYFSSTTYDVPVGGSVFT